MRILQLIPDIGVGGAERMMVNLSLQLMLRHEVRVVSMYGPRGNSLESQLAAAGVNVAYLYKKLGLDPRMFVRLEAIIREVQPDIIHTHRYVLRYALPGMLLNRSRGVHTIHSVAQREVGWSGRVVHRMAFAAGVAPVSIGEAVTASLHEVYGLRPSAVIPHGLPVTDYQRGTRDRDATRRDVGVQGSDVVFGCVARLAPEKNIHLLLEAFALAAARDPRAVLVVVGNGPQRQVLEGKAKDLGVGARVRFLGERGDIPALLAAIDVFVLSSIWEGNPMSVMEAMAAGRPVISTAVGGVPELVVDTITGLLTPSGAPEPLANAMVELASAEETRTRMGCAGAARAAQLFDVAAMAEKYEALYEHVVRHRH